MGALWIVAGKFRPCASKKSVVFITSPSFVNSHSPHKILIASPFLEIRRNFREISQAVGVRVRVGFEVKYGVLESYGNFLRMR